MHESFKLPGNFIESKNVEVTLPVHELPLPDVVYGKESHLCMPLSLAIEQM
jgi:hypothetical protein